MAFSHDDRRAAHRAGMGAPQLQRALEDRGPRVPRGGVPGHTLTTVDGSDDLAWDIGNGRPELLNENRDLTVGNNALFRPRTVYAGCTYSYRLQLVLQVDASNAPTIELGSLAANGADVSDHIRFYSRISNGGTSEQRTLDANGLSDRLSASGPLPDGCVVLTFDGVFVCVADGDVSPGIVISAPGVRARIGSRFSITELC